MGKYTPSNIEPKWQEKWDQEGLYSTPKNPKDKKYVLDMYPYPSGATMHVGHLEGYVGTDIISRYLRMRGHDVLHPMGWDSFGLPAENYAVKTGIHPEESTAGNIETFKRQLASAGLSYDWNREITSSDPNYYKWNQWLFTLLFKKGLAYKKKADVNWCPSCETVLANEQVVDGKCERCETPVVLKKLDQWFLKITAYADRLISGLEGIDWLNEVKVQQKNWIGRKEGIEIEYPIQGSKETIRVFTTRPDTNFGATFVVIAPEHPLVASLLNSQFSISNFQINEIKNYVEITKKKSEEDRIAEGRKKTGVFTGVYAVNQLNEERMPIWVSDFVLMEFGTGAVVGVPGHDLRDFEFAQEFGLPVVRVVVGSDGDTSPITEARQIQEKEGTMINSGFLNNMDINLAIEKIMDYLEEKGWGTRVTTYHLRDWLISRQRYWGTPIPMVFCEKCALDGKGEREDMQGWYTVPDSDLPVLLPKDVDFKPTGESPIARSKSFHEGVVCPICGGPARREVDTMDGYVDSSWYFIRFADPKNDKEFASQEAIRKWLPVDIYVGGGHVVQHLLFARFFWKFLYDEGLIDKTLGDEPFLKLRAPGWILGPDSRKMSKRWGNVVTPDDIIPKYGADTLRMYEMFMGPFDAAKPWSMTGVEGMSRFIKRVWRLNEEIFNFQFAIFNEEDSRKVYKQMHQTIKKVTEDIEGLKFNTAIATLMEYVNFLEDLIGRLEGHGDQRPAGAAKVKCAELEETCRVLLLLLAPFAPYMTEELYQRIIARPQSDEFVSIHQQQWPEYDPELVQDVIVQIPIQVNGKLRGTIQVQSEQAVSEQVVVDKAKGEKSVAKYLDGKNVAKVIFIPGKLVNFVLI
ncbi:MAG: leucine--tRNA ligase [Candidatus Blackburnbacteria bacterium]|nr:leucine--tRNA ligase [Candidatus Blackburnbacteria bacterium]